MTVLVKLLVALVVPVVVLFTLFAFVAFEVSRRDLDHELGQRLEAIAASAATQVRGKYLTDLTPGDEGDRAYQNVVKKLDAVAKVTGAHLFVFDGHYNSRADTKSGIAIGTHYFRAELDRAELERVFTHGLPASSVTFVGNDEEIYKTGYASVRASETEPQIVLALGAQAPAFYFSRLADLRDRLFAWGAGLLAVSVIAAFVATLLITRNIRRLVAAAERIGGGDLREPVRVATHDEVGVLGQTMERMRQQLAERDARTQQMLAGIAHEVRNPLAGMTLFTGILRDELHERDERRGHVDRIRRELGYLERVVNDFLEYARRPKLELADTPCAALFAEVAQLATTDDVIIDVEPHNDLIAHADPTQLRRALLNLAKNAVQAATAEGHRGHGAVRLSARRRGGELALLVWNRGKEIPPEIRKQLFEPFFTTREKGTGLGLAFVSEIATDHGGRVEVASANGETTFTLVLPILSTGRHAAAGTGRHAAAGTGRRHE
ncbi:MAG TPA: HAMP domain-containing sensor histidine kinase [Kofleriaceae bacterium]|nr:HAMP domain-containing sensor histidine kinase [Kofleriaceae bacterium]